MAGVYSGDEYTHDEVPRGAVERGFFPPVSPADHLLVNSYTVCNFNWQWDGESLSLIPDVFSFPLPSSLSPPLPLSHPFLSLSPSVCLYLCLHLCLHLCLYQCVSLCLRLACLSVCLSPSLSLPLSLSFSILFCRVLSLCLNLLPLSVEVITSNLLMISDKQRGKRGY